MALEKRISELTAKSGQIEDTDLMVISDYNGATYDTKKVTGAQIKPFKTYLLSVSQTGTSDPTIDWSYSELNSTVTLTRVTNGNFQLTLSGAEFTSNKTFVQITNGSSGANVIVGAYRQSTTVIRFYSSDSLTQILTDGLLFNAQLEIKIIK
jgi:hypothetical protein